MEQKTRQVKSSRQKLKLLVLAKLFMEKTDEQHHLTTEQIISELDREGISVERKTVYADLDMLRDAGMDIIKAAEKPVAYFLASRTFQLPELKLLVDSVQACQFITEKKSRELIHKLETLCSHQEAQQLNRQVTVIGRIKNENESIYRGVDTIHICIAEGRKISFRYFKYGPDKKKHAVHDGTLYKVSPFMLTWDNGNYYLVGYDSTAGIMKNFRVDRMDTIVSLQQPRDGLEVFEKIDKSVYTRRSFGMFGGKETRVTFLCSNSIADVIFDRFGRELAITKVDDTSFRFSVPIVVSPQFYAWVFGLKDQIEILAPESIRSGMRDHILKVLSQYDPDTSN